MTSSHEIAQLIGELDSLNTGERAAARLAECGSIAIEPLRKYLLEGSPRKIFQPRLWAVEALARLKAKEVLCEYLFRERNIPDPEDRFGEEAVESAAAHFLAAWPDEETFVSLLKLSERRMLNGLIETLAQYGRPETMPYFERALEDDFYRAAAEKAFQKLGKASCDTLVLSAVTLRPGPFVESPSSLERRRSAIRLLNGIGIAPQHWQTLRRLLDEPDEELVVGASKLGMSIASREDRRAISHRLIGLVALAPWHLQEDIEDILTALKDESAGEIAGEVAQRNKQPEDLRARDERLRALLRIQRRFETA